MYNLMFIKFGIKVRCTVLTSAIKGNILGVLKQKKRNQKLKKSFCFSLLTVGERTLNIKKPLMQISKEGTLASFSFLKYIIVS